MTATADPSDEQRFAEDVVRRLRGAGHEALFAGGCVRDLLLGVTPKDYDVATSARPKQVLSLFKRTTAIGAAFGVVQVRGARGLAVEVATFRADGDYRDGRRPESVRFADAREDALRRDFTVNGMFLDPIDHVVLDFVGGEQDLAARTIRAIGDPERRFAEDKLRLLRAARLAARLDFSIEPATRAAIQSMAPQLGVVSGERILAELRMLFESPARARGLTLLADCRLAPVVFEEAGVAAIDRWKVVAERFEIVGSGPFALYVATAFDELAGADAVDAAERFFDRLKGSNAERELCHWLLVHRSDLREAGGKPLAFRKRLYADPRWPWLTTFSRGVGLGAEVDRCEAERAALPMEAIDPPPLVSGDDLVRQGYKPGPEFKDWLQRLRDLQLNGEIATQEDAIRRVEDWAAKP